MRGIISSSLAAGAVRAIRVAGAVREGPIALPVTMTVREFSEATGVGASEILKALLKAGVVANINQQIDYETAAVIAADFGIETVEYVPPQLEGVVENIRDVLAAQDPKDMKPRPPVVTIMGHVDHGKTKLLDAIRSTRVAESEAGGITQHIGAYQVELHGRKITFLDTPGHEAFTAMRARGAQVTDIVVLVVAADDGVMPQTLEAISHVKAAGVPMIVAINKIDAPNANPDRVRQQLANAGVIVEQFGGDVPSVEVSAKLKKNIDGLLEIILLVADLNEYKANPNAPAVGTIIEAEMQAGDILQVMPDLAVAREIALQRQRKQRLEAMATSRGVSLDGLFSSIQQGKIKELNIILKADVQGSIGAIEHALSQLNTDEVQIRIIHRGTGTITESDVNLAIASHAIIIGFNARPDPAARRQAEQYGVDIRFYNIIYQLTEDIKKAMIGMLEPEYREVTEGFAEVRNTFRLPTREIVAGLYVTEGKISRQYNVRVLRNGVVLHDGKIASLKRFKDDVREVQAGYECGLIVEGFNDITPGDTMEFYRRERVERTV
jgi:translation initiation factor IF-2